MAERIKKLSISNAWGEAAKFVSNEAALLTPIAILLLALPSIVLGLTMPDPEAAERQVSTAFLILILPMAFASAIGSLTITVLALRSGITVADALRTALRRFLPLFGASLMVGICVVLAVFVVAMIVLLPVGSAGEGGGGLSSVVATFILLAVLLPLLFYFWSRFSVLAPIAVAERLGPLDMIRRSWDLTRGAGVRLAAAIILLSLAFAIVATVITLVVGIVLGLAAGAPEPGSLTAFIMLLLQGAMTAIFSVYFQAFLARVYVQLAEVESSGS